MERETYDWYDYAAQEFATIDAAMRNYERRGWAAPISGDRTTLYFSHLTD